MLFQLYCLPAEAEATRSALADELAEYAQCSDARIEFEQNQEAAADYDMHTDWAAQHPGQEPGDRAYFQLRVQSPTDVPEPVLQNVELAIWDWINSTYNDDSDEIIEVQAASAI
ncbi:hypothetical protein [Nocardia rhizosphaerae]|uniref:Uncharacterized protein n=1 Tax=Nocardia rhizosphaerae TaxID=1691571 RepID=A0ABV8LB60_9NOCA